MSSVFQTAAVCSYVRGKTVTSDEPVRSSTCANSMSERFFIVMCFRALVTTQTTVMRSSFTSFSSAR